MGNASISVDILVEELEKEKKMQVMECGPSRINVGCLVERTRELLRE